MTERDTSMAGKVCLITGATAGLGLATAQALAQRGATVVIVGRNSVKSAAVVHRIQELTGNPSVSSLRADLSSQGDIRRLAEAFKLQHRRLDVLINNAGALHVSRRLSVDGIEMTFAVNHLGYFLLTRLLLDMLIASAPSRIVNVSSAAHEGTQMDFDDPQGEGGYGGIRGYQQSKLANLLFTYALAPRLVGAGVTVNALHPGLIATNLYRSYGPIGALLKLLLRMRGTSPAVGARTIVYLATSPEVEGVTGRYFSQQRAVASSPASYDQVAANRLWEMSEALTGLSS
ncbi:MAG: SDR family oxidoreductase [Dehalococcoidia bacterium]|nr:SDR family oxidoreductase [Dehalococcoidia bacterium]